MKYYSLLWVIHQYSHSLSNFVSLSLILPLFL